MGRSKNFPVSCRGHKYELNIKTKAFSGTRFLAGLKELEGNFHLGHLEIVVWVPGCEVLSIFTWSVLGIHLFFRSCINICVQKKVSSYWSNPEIDILVLAMSCGWIQIF